MKNTSNFQYDWRLWQGRIDNNKGNMGKTAKQPKLIIYHNTPVNNNDSEC